MGLINIVNELVVSNVEKSINFYKDNFGFVVEFSEGVPVTWAQIKKDDFIIMLEDYKEVEKEMEGYPEKNKNSNIIVFEYSSDEEVKNIYSFLKKQNVNFFIDYKETDYGKVEFGVYDLDDNMILISSLINND